MFLHQVRSAAIRRCRQLTRQRQIMTDFSRQENMRSAKIRRCRQLARQRQIFETGQDKIRSAAIRRCRQLARKRQLSRAGSIQRCRQLETQQQLFLRPQVFAQVYDVTACGLQFNCIMPTMTSPQRCLRISCTILPMATAAQIRIEC